MFRRFVGIGRGLILLFATATAQAATVTVTGTADTTAPDGVCTLREAITNINSASNVYPDCLNTGLGYGITDQIRFNIPGAGVHTISPTSQLPVITRAVLLDGYSQPGAVQNSAATGWNAVIRIELDGSVAGPSVSGLEIGTEYVEVRGLAVFGFSLHGIRLGSLETSWLNRVTNTRIYGNIIGLRADGATAAGNGRSGVEINDLNTGHYDNHIGGSGNNANRNIISANGHSGVYIAKGSTEWVQNNYIGVDSSGVLARGNGYGVMLYLAERSHISSNIISGNRGSGINLTGSATTGTQIYGNRIGVNVLDTPLGNGGYGVITYASDTQIGSDSVQANIIAANGQAGVAIANSATGVRIQRNSIYANGTLGIDLGILDGVTVNDPNDGDSGANRFQNFPVLTTASPAGVIVGSLDSVASTSFVVEFFSSPVCDGSGHGEGQTFLGATNVSTNILGDAMIVHGAGALTPGSAITATATNVDTGDTSEFSACINVSASAGPEIAVSGQGVSIADGDFTPSLADWTDFGNTTVGAPLTRNFVIGNSGLATLNLGANAVSLTGAGCAEFSVTVQPAATVAVGGSASFQVQYLPTNSGTDACTVMVANDDSDENPFDFVIQATAAVVSAPEIGVFGLGLLIVDGDATPSLADNTDFGPATVGTPVTQTYTIVNSGTVPLNLGASAVSLVGATCGEFAVSAQPSIAVAAAASTTFSVQYTPVNTGADLCQVRVNNDDPDESPYEFNVQGAGVAPPGTPPVMGNVPDQNATVGSAFSLALAGFVTLTEGDPIAGYAIASGSLPPGLTLNSVTGAITGTPTTPGTYNITVTASDDDGTSNADAIQFTVTAAAAPNGAVPVPALSEWGLMLLSLLLAGLGLRRQRRSVS